MIQFDEHIFQMGWKPPTRTCFSFHKCTWQIWIFDPASSFHPGFRPVRCRLGLWWRWSFGTKSWMRNRWQKPPTIWWPNWLQEYRRTKCWQNGGGDHFPRETGNPPLFGSCALYVGNGLMASHETSETAFQLENLWIASFAEILDESWWWKHRWWSKSHSHTGNQGTRSTKKHFLCFNWVMFVSLAELLE